MKKVKYSIVIPTYNKLERALKPCVESVLKYSNLDEIEIIIVSNGCKDGTHRWLNEMRLQYPDVIEYRIIEEPIGYTKAGNIGIKIAVGDYIVLLNNDTQILQSPPNTWLELLVAPMEQDEKVGITGPMLAHSPSANAWFLIFFCVMIRRSVIDTIGLMDEIYAPGYGEDTDYCLKAVQAGFKVQQVPNDERLYSDHEGKRMIGNFPIWHEGNVTFREFDDNDKHLLMNNEILNDRWNPPAVTITEAQKIEGFMSDIELEWLAIQATKYKKIIEVGSWLGKSTRALADNIKDGIVVAVDHWKGSEGERDTFHQGASWGEGDWAYYTFMQNNYQHVFAGTILPLRMHSRNAAALLKQKGFKADLIFLDGGHTEPEVEEDIKLWMPLLKDGGILCGHDYYFENAWPGVKAAVDKLTRVKIVPNASIWWKMVGKLDFVEETNQSVLVEAIPEKSLVSPTSVIDYAEAVKPVVYDCFPFFNELDLLDIRFAELDSVVDRWVIAECIKTHSGQDKPLYFRDNLERYAKYLHKITHIVVDDLPEVPANPDDRSWAIERHQRDALMKGLVQCRDTDVILIGDADEIPKKEAIQHYLSLTEHRLSCISLRPCYYYMNCESHEPWNWLRILPYRIMKNMTPCGVRYVPNYDMLNDVIKDNNSYAGWHYSFLGGTEKVIEKIENTAHQEYNKDIYKNPDIIKTLVDAGKDILFRPIAYNYTKADPNLDYPQYVRDNWDKFITNQFIKII